MQQSMQPKSWSRSQKGTLPKKEKKNNDNIDLAKWGLMSEAPMKVGANGCVQVGKTGLFSRSWWPRRLVQKVWLERSKLTQVGLLVCCADLAHKI